MSPVLLWQLALDRFRVSISLGELKNGLISDFKNCLVSLILSPLELGLPYMDQTFPCRCTASFPRPFRSMHLGGVALTKLKATRITWSKANRPHKKSEARSALQVMAQPWNATQQPKRALCAKWSCGTKITLLDGKRRSGILKRKDRAIFVWP